MPARHARAELEDEVRQLRAMVRELSTKVDQLSAGSGRRIAAGRGPRRLTRARRPDRPPTSSGLAGTRRLQEEGARRGR